MSDICDRILALIDEGLLDAERQRTTEPAMSLAEPPAIVLYENGSWTGGYSRSETRVHVCVPECGENGHVASATWEQFDDAETVYVRLHTSEPRTPDDGSCRHCHGSGCTACDAAYPEHAVRWTYRWTSTGSGR